MLNPGSAAATRYASVTVGRVNGCARGHTGGRGDVVKEMKGTVAVLRFEEKEKKKKKRISDGVAC